MSNDLGITRGGFLAAISAGLLGLKATETAPIQPMGEYHKGLVHLGYPMGHAIADLEPIKAVFQLIGGKIYLRTPAEPKWTFATDTFVDSVIYRGDMFPSGSLVHRLGTEFGNPYHIAAGSSLTLAYYDTSGCVAHFIPNRG
jgi:hypothetical protein